MPRLPNILAITTRDTITNLWLMAEKAGGVTIYLRDRDACYLTRNKLYAHRSKLRKTMAELQGIAASHLDGFTFDFGPAPAGSPAPWYFTITYDAPIEFILEVPEGWEGDLPHFDSPAVNERWDAAKSEWIKPLPPDIYQDPPPPPQRDDDENPF